MTAKNSRRAQAIRMMQQVEGYTPEPNWRADAVCRSEDPELFFPTTGGAGINRARRICGGCSVGMSCLATALELGNTCSGVWAGTTEEDRRGFLAWRTRTARARARKAAQEGSA